jgi:predicted ATPase
VARIVSFRVDGLAGRETPLSTRLQDDVNVFFGINGSGKTTLLKILYSALSTETSILEGLPFKSAEVEVYLNRYKSTFTRRIEQISVPPKAEVEHEGVRQHMALSHRISQSAKLQTEGPEWKSEPAEPEGGALTSQVTGYLPISRLYRAVEQTFGGKAMSEEELDARFAAEVKRRWQRYQSEISTRISEVQGEGLAEILHLTLSGDEEAGETGTSLELTDAYERVANFLGRQEGFEGVLGSREDFEEKYRTQPRIKSIVRQIDQVEKQIEQLNAPRNRFQKLLETMYSGNKRIVFTERDVTIELSSKVRIGLPSLSSGEKQLFFIALEAIRCGAGALVIDEPELSMHVDWQKKLIASLRELSPRMQVIAATHSPEIMADIPDEKVFSL